MAFFRRLYDKVMHWSAHRHAVKYLAGVSFAESSFFPVPPDVMLIPMVLKKPTQSWVYAAVTTIASVLGGILGYLIGFYFYDLIGKPLVEALGYQQGYATAVSWFDEYGFLAVFIAGFTPIPYKVFTIAAGVAHMAFLPFVVASMIGRGLRFFLVAALTRYIGKRMEPAFIRYIDLIGWAVVALIILAIVITYWV